MFILMGERLPRIKPLPLIKALSKIGIRVGRQKGSHAQLCGIYKGQTRFTTIPIHGGELPHGVLLAVLKDCGISRKELIELLQE